MLSSGGDSQRGVGGPVRRAGRDAPPERQSI